MSTNTGDLFVEPRLRALKAVQNNDIKLIEALLISNPELIKAKTISTGASLLHIATERGLLEMCDFLLENNHETNPVDKNGKTPYQSAKSPEMQALLVDGHKAYLLNKFYTSSNIPTPNVSCLDSLARIVQVIDRSKYKNLPMNTMGDKSFGVTSIRPAPGARSEKELCLVTIFRTDILMTPYYGELLVIHENEQAIQFIERLHAGQHPKKRIDSEMCQIEARAFIKFVASGLELYPFLKNYPEQSDTPDVVEAKKMFLSFGLVSLTDYINDCTDQQVDSLQLLKDYEIVTLHTNSVLNEKNRFRNTKIYNEASSKYTSEERVEKTNSFNANK